MSTTLIGFKYHTTAVGNGSSSIFSIGSQNVSERMTAGRSAEVENGVLTAALASARRRSPSNEGLPLPNTRSSGAIAKSLVELSHCGCGKLLVAGRQVLAIAAYLSAAHLERFWIAHIARMQNV